MAIHHVGVKPSLHEIMLGGGLGLIALPISLFFSTALLFALPLVMDRGYGVFDALATSWKIVLSHLWPLLGMMILLGLLQLAGLVALCVGLLVTMPVLWTSFAVAYEELFGSRVRPS